MTPEIILGPPGTGKTTRLLGEVDAELAAGVNPARIGYLSFTRRAADEAVERAGARFNLERGQLPFFRTIHSLCFQQMGYQRGDIMEGDRLQAFAKHAGEPMRGSFSDDGTLTGYELGDRMMHTINMARIRQVPLLEQYTQFPDGLPWTRVERMAEVYRTYKQGTGLVDYTDMLEEFVRAKPKVLLDRLFVDEAQDLSMLQWGVINHLARDVGRLVIAGDDDQAIFRWAGADVDHLIDMPGQVSVLGQSYRVPPAIQPLANSIISRIGHRRAKQWAPREGETGEVSRVGDFDQAVINEGSVLILVRNSYLLRERVEGVLRRSGIVYEKNGWPSIRSGALDAITAWEELRSGRPVRLALARRIYEQMSVYKGFKRGFKSLPSFGEDGDRQVTMAELKHQGGLLTEKVWHDALDRLPTGDMQYIRAVRQRGEKLRAAPRVKLSTIHSAKGGEADHVVLFTEMALRSHQEMLVLPDDEARVWYVGVTRARRQLTVVDTRGRGGQRLTCPWV